MQHAVDQAVPGTTIFIREGSYHEEVNLAGLAGAPGKPVTIASYNGETVTFDGTAPITSSWTLEEGNVYTTTLSEDITQLFVDDQIMTLARFPNALVWSDEMWTARTGKQGGSKRGNIVGADIVGEAGVSFDGCVGLFNFGNFETIAARVVNHTAGENNFSYTPSAGIYRHSDGYFLEGGVDNAERAMLDIPQEWAYDESTKTLSLWADDGENPTGRSVAGKVRNFAFTGDAATQYVTLDGLDFFATAFQFLGSDHLTIKNCNLRYHTCSERALGSIAVPETARVSGDETDFCEDLFVFNNTFRYSDTSALIVSFLENPVIENNLFQDVNYGCLSSAAVQVSQANSLILRRNTLINAGPFSGFRFGEYKIDGNDKPYLVEYNYAEKCSRLQDDGTAYYSAQGGLIGSMTRFNWAYDNYERDFRWDGLNRPLEGVEANAYRNVAHATQAHKPVNLIGAAYKLKGDFHRIMNNLGVQRRAKFEISIEKGGNANSQSFNNAANYLSGNDSDGDIPGTESHNYLGQREHRPMEFLLRNTDDFDYRPKADSVEIIDQGIEVAALFKGESVSVTAGFLGEAPDIGAYEFGDENYNIPGYQFEQASFPIPSHNNETAEYDSDLMWRGGLGSDYYNVYLGTEAKLT